MKIKTAQKQGFLKIVNFLILVVFALGFLNIVGCQNKDESSTLNQKEEELKLKEKELQMKEREMLDKKEADLTAKEKELQKTKNIDPSESNKKNINLDGAYSGSIKDGTKWYVYIKNFNGNSFSGYNEIYWKKTPDGFNTNFTGTYDPSTREIIMKEDKNAKGSGKFTGKISADGKTLSGDWSRYSDGNSFTWNLNKLEDEY